MAPLIFPKKEEGTGHIAQNIWYII